MIKRLKVENFKCFSQMEMVLQPLTLLCGVNSGGKSSVIQAILMAMEAIESEKEYGNLDLMNCKYNTDLYSFGELLFEDAADEIIKVALQIEKQEIEIEFKSAEGDNNIHFSIGNIDTEKVRQKKIWYLGSERMISKYQVRGNAEKLDLGKDNEYIGYILERGRSIRIETDQDRNLNEKEAILFATQVNQWLDYVLPENQVMATTSGTDNMVSLNFGKDFRYHRTNVGYGIGFVLPIIVAGLLARKGDILIVENPELHLHPKAQSELSLFFAKVAKSGVQVLLETHSDHIVNGIQKAVVNPDCELEAQDTGIYYFNSENKVKHLTLDENANLSEWPEDFMEQVEKDLYYLRKMRVVNGHKRADRQ